MKANFKLVNPDDMDATIELTMALRQWRQLRDCIEDKYPGWDFVQIIRRLIDKATQQFDEKGEITK